MIRKLLAAAILFAGPAWAGPAGDAVFATGVLDGLSEDQVVHYSHVRTGPQSPEFLPINEGSVDLKVALRDQDRRVVELTMRADGRVRALDDLPAVAGNPILMAFMESSLRSMAKITGGSPFYIRNRMREALRNGGEVSDVTVDFDGRRISAQEAVFRPFDGDPNAESMGVFADLAIRFVVSDEVPGYFVVFAAATPDGELAYSEEIRLMEEN